MTYVFDELIDSSIAKHFLAIVFNRFIWPLAISFAKPQPCERLHRASRVRIYTKYWQRASYSCRFTLKNFPSAIGLYVNWSSISLRPNWGIYCSRFRRVQHLTIESATGSLFWLGYSTIACHGTENSTEAHRNWYVWKFEFTFLITLKFTCGLTHYKGSQTQVIMTSWLGNVNG